MCVYLYGWKINKILIEWKSCFGFFNENCERACYLLFWQPIVSGILKVKIVPLTKQKTYFYWLLYSHVNFNYDKIVNVLKGFTKEFLGVPIDPLWARILL